MRTIAVVTGARSDYSILLPVMREIQSRPDMRMQLLVTGMHLAPGFGLTVREIEKDGIPISERIDMLLASDTAEGVAKSMGLCMIGFSQALARLAPDMLLVLGDRSETLAAVTAALPFRIPVAHISGGDVTTGAIDDCIRHAITKLSHLHFASTQESYDRLLQMGEEPWRVQLTGSPSIDNILGLNLVPIEKLEAMLNVSLDRPFLLSTLHPETQAEIAPEAQIKTLLAALEDFPDYLVIFTGPNSDRGGLSIMAEIESWVQQRQNARLARNFGGEAYSTLMRRARAVVGNSSSGVVETPSFKIPCVNIGVRQNGRIHCANVIDVDFDQEQISQAIATACSAEFKEHIADVRNPFGDGNSRFHIVDALQSVDLGSRLIVKCFRDMPRLQIRSDVP